MRPRAGTAEAAAPVSTSARPRPFPAPYQLDARRCISYLTIEFAGPVPLEFREAMGNRIYGCDDCLAVCPWNKFAERAAEQAFHARESLKQPALADLAVLDDTSLPGAVLQVAGQADRAGPLRPERALRHRQFGRCGAGGGRAGANERSRPGGGRSGGLGDRKAEQTSLVRLPRTCSGGPSRTAGPKLRRWMPGTSPGKTDKKGGSAPQCLRRHLRRSLG